MEFPDLGKHCREASCNRLDFLPLQCDSCNQVYCSTHFHYAQHACKGQRKDVQVPICPLCEKPVPTAPGVEPDLTVSRHIDEQCKSENKIFTNRCTHKGCKRKELIPVTCTECGRNYCLRHRHTADHQCQGRAAIAMDQRTTAAKAAEYRKTKKTTSLFNTAPRPSAASVHQRISNVQVQNIQGTMSEDEALARALALSIYELDESAGENRPNEAEATSSAAQRNTRLRVGGRDGQQQNDKERCLVS